MAVARQRTNRVFHSGLAFAVSICRTRIFLFYMFGTRLLVEPGPMDGNGVILRLRSDRTTVVRLLRNRKMPSFAIKNS